MKEIVLATDLGGTNLRMSAIDREGTILYKTRRETPKSEIPHEIVSAIKESAGECLAEVRGRGTVIAIAAAVPATVSSARGLVLNAPNVPALSGFRISAALESELNLPCFLENDANSAAVGEGWRGASRDFDNSICVTLGTGVGGGIIIGGEILHGVDGTAGEIGHICLEPFGAPCGCGSRGCLEQYASATAIVRMTRELGFQYPNSKLPGNPRLSALEIYDAGMNGDELALEVFRKQGFYLGLALAGLVNVLNPEAIVIGGGASAGWDLFIPQTRQIVKERSYREPGERVKIMRAELGDDAGVLGVAHLAFENVSKLA